MTTIVSVTPTYYTKRGGWCSAEPLQYQVTVRTVMREITFKPRPLWTGEKEVMYTQKPIQAGSEVAIVTLARGGYDMMLVKPRAALAGNWQDADIYTNLGKDPERIAKFLADHFEDASHV